jgi:hypothetical protein
MKASVSRRRISLLYQPVPPQAIGTRRIQEHGIGMFMLVGIRRGIRYIGRTMEGYNQDE